MTTITSIDGTIVIPSVEDMRRNQRIVSALESIGVNLDETDIEALESLASSDSYRLERDDFRTFVNNATNGIIEDGREREQEQAIDALTKVGFVLDDEDGETWTRRAEKVKIECTHPAESTYKWSYDTYQGMLEPYVFDEGKSGDFHRLLALIGQAEVKQ